VFGFRRHVLLSVLLLVAAPWALTSLPAEAATRAPVVAHLSRHSATTKGKVTLLVQGARFVKVRSVRFGTVSAHYRVLSAKRLKVTVPAHAAGTVHVVVTTRAGHSKKRHVDLFTFRRVAPPAPTLNLAGWSSKGLPLPANADTTQSASLSQVSCASKHLCAALGGYRVGGTNRALIARYADGTWTSFDPEPVDAQGIGLNSVSCAGTTCVVAGELLVNGHWEGMFDVLRNGVWTQSIAPHPVEEPSTPTQFTQVQSVSCYAQDACVAVGYYSVGKTTVAGATWRLSGTTWTPATLPVPADSDGTDTDGWTELDHVGCNASAQCAAGGSYVSGGDTVGLLGHFDGTAWTTARAPLPTDGSQVHVNDAVCGSDGKCLVVGQYYDGSAHEQGLLEAWSGSWNAAKAALPADAADNPWTLLESAACNPSAGCSAAGSYLDTSGHHHSLIEHQAAGGWSGVEPVPPHGAATGADSFAELHGISCVGRACATVGDYQDTTDALRPLLNAYPGGATYAPALPAGAKNSSAALLSVSCSADAFCMGVGYYTSPASPSLALVGHT